MIARMPTIQALLSSVDAASRKRRMFSPSQADEPARGTQLPDDHRRRAAGSKGSQRDPVALESSTRAPRSHPRDAIDQRWSQRRMSRADGFEVLAWRSEEHTPEL